MSAQAAGTLASLPRFDSWVAGSELEGRAGTRPAIDPSRAEPFAQVSLLDAEQAAGAVEAAWSAQPAWAALSLRERGRHLLRLRRALALEADEVARLISREQGKPFPEAHTAEVIPSLETLKHLGRHAEDLLREDPVEAEVVLLAHKDARVLYEPFGVVLVITPWNYPFYLALAAVAAALVAGNSVVLKPAPAGSLVGLRIGALARQAGLPAGVLNVLTLDDALAPGLVEHPRVAKVVFTGSVATGRKVMTSAAKNLTPVLLELGGKDAAIVCRDADLDRAARGIVWGAFMNAGQTCASVERVYVEEPVADAFLERVVAQTRRLRMGDPQRADVELGPMTLASQRRIVEEHVADAVALGARRLTGGETPAGPGYFYPPTVLADVDHAMRVMREESFGPLLPVMRVKDLDEAIRLANDSPYGLTASAWTRSADTARRLEAALAAGSVTINDCVFSAGEPSAPWGGFKHSGFGRSHGLAGLREMVQVKYTSRDDGRGPMVWWYPYGEDFSSAASAMQRALHASSIWARLRAHLFLLATGRFRRRAGVLRLLQHFDKLF